jgi:hypothetical protein
MKKTSSPKSVAEVQVPPSDWVPLDNAPYYCYPEGFITSSEEWRRALEAEARKIVGQPHFKSTEPWSFGLPEGHLPTWLGLEIRSGGICTDIWPGGACIRPADGGLFDSRGELIAPSQLWRGRVLWEPSDLDDMGKATIRHKRMLADMAISWHQNFVCAVASDAIRLMARKNSVLAPFEHVRVDQWHFFRLDEFPEQPPENWFDPRDADFGNDSSHCTATGPAGERLFGIYVAPGPVSAGGESLQQKCRLWVRTLLRDYPDRAPKPKEELFKDAAKEFPGLPKKIIRDIVLRTMTEAGQQAWIRSGRPRLESSQKSASKK